MTGENELKIKEMLVSLRSGLKDRRDIRRLRNAIYEAEALDIEGKLPIDLEEILKESRKYYDELRRQHGEETTMMRFGDLKSRHDAVQKIMYCVAVGQKYIYDTTTNTDRPAFEILQDAQRLLKEACENSLQYELGIAEEIKQNHPRSAMQRLEKALQEPFDETSFRILREKLDEIKHIVDAQEKAEKILSDALQEDDYLRRFEGILYAQSVFQNIPGLSEQLNQSRHAAFSLLARQIDNVLVYAEAFIKIFEFDTVRKQILDAEFRLSSWPEQEKPLEINDLDEKLQETKSQVLYTEQSWHEYIRYAKIIREQIINPDKRAVANQLFDRIIQDDHFQSFPDLRILKMEVENYSGLGEQLAIAKSAYAQSDWSKVIEITANATKSGMAGQLANDFYILQNDAQLELNIHMLYDKIFAENYKEARYLLSRILSTQDENKRSVLESRLSSEIQFLREKTGF